MNIQTNFKQWWDNLHERERKIVLFGAIALIIVLVYLIIWSPLSDAVAQRKKAVHSQQALLHYLHGASVEIQTLKAQGISTSISPAQTDLLTLVEQSASSQQLSTYLKQVEQPQPNQISLTFDNVPFDNLLRWLEMLSTTHGVNVIQMNATRLGTPGLANVTMTLG